MLSHWLVIGLAAVALARPETYKENEEFNYSRSSTDEGSKSGFYEAQKGNVGGNYERAHNMDAVAQGQMSDAINQVGANVDEVAKSKHGNLYSQAYTSGIYGQRAYDTRNLAGRNFQENVYGSNSNRGQSSRYQSSTNLNPCYDCTYVAPVASEYNPDGYESSHSSYQAASKHHSSTTYGQNGINSNGYRVVPVKIVARPQTPVNIGVQAGIEEHTSDSSFAKNEHESRFNSQNSLANNDGRVFISAPSSGLSHEKHYESSYKKEWEKHTEVTPIPLTIPVSNVETVDTYNQNYRQNLHQSHSQNHASDIETLNTAGLHNYQTGVHENGYNSAYNSEYHRVAEPVNNRYVVLSATPEFVATSQGARSSQHASAYTAGSRSQSQSAYRDQSLTQGHLSTNNDNLLAQHNHDALVTLAGNSADTSVPAPKSYESSYSYHKSWERQGDPYIITPAVPAYESSGTVQSEKLQSYSNRHASTNSRYTHGYQDDCVDDEHQRHVRSATYGSHSGIQAQVGKRVESAEDLEQQAEQIGQQRDYLGQQTEAFGQESEDFSQQSEMLGQQTEDLGQQTEDFGQQTEYFGQQSEHFGHDTRHVNQEAESFYQRQRNLNSQQQLPQGLWQNRDSYRRPVAANQYLNTYADRPQHPGQRADYGQVQQTQYQL